VINGCGTWNITLREECRLKVFEKRILSEFLGSKEGSTMRNFIVFTVPLI
jgi:hypothetical protein